jgi:hypothetical protein
MSVAGSYVFKAANPTETIAALKNWQPFKNDTPL